MSKTVAKQFNTQEAARFIGTTPATMKTWRYKGDGPKYKTTGRSVFYRKTDLVQFKKSFKKRNRETTEKAVA